MDYCAMMNWEVCGNGDGPIPKEYFNKLKKNR
jgi:hypothetical protein